MNQSTGYLLPRPGTLRLSPVAALVFFLLAWLCVGANPSQAQNNIDAIVFNDDTDVYYLFEGEQYYRKEYGKVTSGPYLTKENWDGWPWRSGEVDAVVYNSDRQVYYFFQGSEYARKPKGQPFDAGYPRSVTQWSAWPSSWRAGPLGAAIYKTSSQTYYLFRGTEYVRHKHGQPADFLRSIGDRNSWSGWQRSNSVYAGAFVPNSDAYYFFYADRYAKKDVGKPFSGLRSIKRYWSVDELQAVNPWEKSFTGRGIYQMFQAVESSGRVPAPSTTALSYTGMSVVGGGDCVYCHVQGVSKLADNRFIFAQSKAQPPGRWIVQRTTGSSDTQFFEYGGENHSSPLQASGYLVIMPSTKFGPSMGGTERVYLVRMKSGKSFDPVYTFPESFGTYKAGITYDPDRDRHYVVIGDRLFVSNGLPTTSSELSFTEMSTDEPMAGGQGGTNLVYDYDTRDGTGYLLSFGFGDASGEDQTLYIRRFKLKSGNRAEQVGRDLAIPFTGIPNPEGTSWKYGGGLKVFSDRIEIYRTDMGGGVTNFMGDIHVDTFTFRFP